MHPRQPITQEGSGSKWRRSLCAPWLLLWERTACDVLAERCRWGTAVAHWVRSYRDTRGWHPALDGGMRLACIRRREHASD
jgi:hypothetical protein